MAVTLCTFPDCGGAVRAKGLCNAHYEQQRTGKPLTPVVRKHKRVPVCTVPSCNSKPHGLGLCWEHYGSEYRQRPEYSGMAVAWSHNRRTLERAAGKMSPTAYDDLVKEWGPYCLFPGCLVDDGLQIDHVIPLSWGGTNDMGNLQLLCSYHNASKNNRHNGDYRPRPDAAEYLRENHPELLDYVGMTIAQASVEFPELFDYELPERDC